jgi:hypothetical protein
MAQRVNRNAKTKPRRIHATDREWTVLKASADVAGLSVSGYIVDLAERARGVDVSADITGAIFKLTACHKVLVDFAQFAARDPEAVRALATIKALEEVAEKLDRIATELPRVPGTRGSAR